MVNRPTHLILAVIPRPRPVTTSQNHQLGVKALPGPSSCWLVKAVKPSAVRAVPIIRGESSKISRAWVRRPFSVKNRFVSRMNYPIVLLSFRRTEYDKTSSHEGSGATASSRLKSEEHGRSQKDTADSREHAHGDIWNARLDVVLSNLLEIEATVEPSEPAEEGNHELCEGWVDVHEELALDVLGSEAAEAVADIESVHILPSEQLYPPMGGLHTGLRQTQHCQAGKCGIDEQRQTKS